MSLKKTVDFRLTVGKMFSVEYECEDFLLIYVFQNLISTAPLK